MLFLRLDQALQLLDATKNMKEKLVVRYMVFNGLSPMEVSAARIEDLDPVENILFLSKRHWKKNCVCNIDAETVKLQIIYSGNRKKGPLLRSMRGGHFSRFGIWQIVRIVAMRTMIPDKKKVSPLVLKRTFAREYLKTPGNTVCSLQKQFGHKHLWSTAHYLRFTLEDVRRNHVRMMDRIRSVKTESVRQIS
jgi:integrase